jgi:hypothetical protein
LIVHGARTRITTQIPASKALWLKTVDAHVGHTKAIRRHPQACVWQRCRAHHHFTEGFAHAGNLLHRMPMSQQGMVTASLRSVFAQESAGEILTRSDDLAASLAESFPRASELMAKASACPAERQHIVGGANPRPHVIVAAARPQGAAVSITARELAQLNPMGTAH